jgi:hypothetical protein
VQILTLRPSVTREQAVAQLQGGSLARWLGRAALRSVADVYVPFRLYRVEVHSRARPWTSWFAVDSVTGGLDPYQFDRPPEPAELLRLETRNRPAPALGEDEAVRLLQDKLRRVVFQTGFFRVRDLRFQIDRLPVDLHVPYWLGFYGAADLVRLRVLDGVRRRLEGGRARALFEGWLAA